MQQKYEKTNNKYVKETPSLMHRQTFKTIRAHRTKNKNKGYNRRKKTRLAKAMLRANQLHKHNHCPSNAPEPEASLQRQQSFINRQLDLSPEVASVRTQIPEEVAEHTAGLIDEFQLFFEDGAGGVSCEDQE